MDLQVFAYHGVHGMAVPTALTIQTTTGVRSVHPTFPSVVTEQLNAALEDIRPHAVKVGMLATDDIVLRVAPALEGLPVPRVIDPVLRASDGSFLLERRGWGHLIERVIAGCALVTPNLDEARELTHESDPERAARILLEAGAGAVLVKGGHAEGSPDDLLLTAEGGSWLRGTRVEVGPVHGTGCALSAAIAARLARGESLLEAVEGAKGFLEAALRRSAAQGAEDRLLRLADPAESEPR
jgi:hydroxymethylpyrimidine/phosphomethylpyrimidine kinase